MRIHESAISLIINPHLRDKQRDLFEQARRTQLDNTH
jgi:hypothetical protein